MTNKLNLGVLFGGRSCEHEVSVISARSVLQAIDQNKYNICLIGIDKAGYWKTSQHFENLVDSGSVKSLQHQSGASTSDVSLTLHDQGNVIFADTPANQPTFPTLDVIFPVLHGTFGEDGTLQGALEMAGIPYVGCGVAASSLAMDKALAKKVFEASSIPQAPYYIVTHHKWRKDSTTLIEQLETGIGYPLFIKPANMGSSVGVNKAHDRDQLITSINHALEFDNKVVVEQSMENCREVECSVLGNHDPIASVVGEIIPGAEFYNYETKYLDDKSDLVIPADLPASVSDKIRQLSIDAFTAIDGKGLSRVDFFVHKDTEEIYLNEVNTMPGFTPISMYPQLWAASGISYAELIDRLINLAIEHHQSKQSIKRVF